MILAVVFAIAFAAFELADAIAQAVVTAIQYELLDPESGDSGLSIRIGETDIELSYVLQAGIALILMATLFLAIWRLTRRGSRTCPECLSAIPSQASICRYCTTDLPKGLP